MEKVVRPATAQRLHPATLLPLCLVYCVISFSPSPPPIPSTRFHLSLSDCVYLGSDRTDGHVWSVQQIPGGFGEGARPLNCITRNSNKGMYSNESNEYQNCLHPTHPPMQKISFPMSQVCWQLMLTKSSLELHMRMIYGTLADYLC